MDSLEYTGEQEQVSSIFKRYRNDISIYTEDTSKDKSFYTVLFQRLLEGTGLKIQDVYPLGSSHDVIDACQRDTSDNKRIYIVDGDIYMLYNPKQQINHLFVLDAYCMENLVIDEQAVVHAICNFCGTYMPEDVAKKLEFHHLIDSHLDLITLFYYKALVSRFYGRFELNSYAKYCNKTDFAPSMVQDEINAITSKLISDGLLTQTQLDQEIDIMKQQFPINHEIFLNIVSGKDFIINMISYCADKLFDHIKGMNKIAWKYNFAQKCSLDRLEALKQAMLSA